MNERIIWLDSRVTTQFDWERSCGLNKIKFWWLVISQLKVNSSVWYCSYGQSHQLTFEATVEDRTPVNRRLRGFMAVDNIDLVSEDDVSVACRGHCNFDGGFCGWTNDVDDDFDWRLGRGSTNGATGPSRDHNNFASGLPSRGYAYIVNSAT